MKFFVLVVVALLSFKSQAATCGQFLMQPNAKVGLQMIETAINKANKRRAGSVSEHWMATVKAARDEYRQTGTTYGFQSMQRSLGQMCHESTTSLERVLSY